MTRNSPLIIEALSRGNVTSYFSRHSVIVDDALNLSVTLRSHLAGDLHDWVRLLLNGELEEAREKAQSIRGASFNLYVTRDLDAAKTYVRTRYDGNIDSRFGLLASSKAKTLPEFGMDGSFQATRRFRAGPWYNDPPSSPQSCCQLRAVATEFACQGLELDFPIVGWDSDLLWNGTAWASKAGRTKARDPHKLRINSYRVLLTRGRDGMMIFVPNISLLDSSYSALVEAGCAEFVQTIRSRKS